MSPALGFSNRRFVFQKRSLVLCDLDLKFNFEILKINLTLLVPAKSGLTNYSRQISF
jgi:hypothetical protein